MAYSKNEDRFSVWAYSKTVSTGTAQTTSRVTQVSTWQDVKAGQAVPKFRALIKQGSGATSPYTRSANNVVGLDAFGHNQSIWFSSDPAKLKYPESIDGFALVQPPNLGTLVISSSVDSQALTNCYKSLAGIQTHAKGLQFLGEFHEVISMFRHPYRTAVSLVDSYTLNVQKLGKKHRPRESRRGRDRFTKAVADSWLETSFGLRPLISDVKDLAEAAARFQHDRRRENAVGYGEAPTAGSSTASTQVAGTNYIQVFLTERTSVVHKVKYRAACDWSASGAFGSMSRLSELAGFRPDLFIPTIYELLPWSFLVDYVSNLGTVIETGCAAQNMIKFGVRTTQIVSTKTSMFSPNTFSDPTVRILYVNSHPGRIKQIRTYFDRTPFGQLPNVPLTVNLPGKPLQYTNVLALWASRLKI